MLTKEKLHQTIDVMSENLTLEQVIEEIILLDKIDQGINDANNGKTFTTDEVKTRLNKWLK